MKAPVYVHRHAFDVFDVRTATIASGTETPLHPLARIQSRDVAGAHRRGDDLFHIQDDSLRFLRPKFLKRIREELARLLGIPRARVRFVMQDGSAGAREGTFERRCVRERVRAVCGVLQER